MAFKIGSLQELNSIADTLLEFSHEAQVNSNTAISCVDDLNRIISGQGVDSALVKLMDVIDKDTQIIVNNLNRISRFLKTQSEYYTQNEDDVSSNLGAVQNVLDNLLL